MQTKIEKMMVQVKQEMSDRQIIVDDLEKLKEQKKKLMDMSKTIYTKNVMEPNISQKKRPTRSHSVDVVDEKPQHTAGEKKVTNFRGVKNRMRRKSVTKEESSRQSKENQLPDFGLSGVSYEPVFK